MFTIFSIVIVLVIVCLVSFTRAIKSQKQLLESYALTITENSITRYQFNFPTISLYHTEVQEILKTSKNGFIIKGKTAEDIIYVPPQIDNRDDVETRLNQIKPITVYRSKNVFETYPLIGLLLMLVLLAGVYGSTNKIVGTVCGVPLIAYLVWSFFKIRRSKNVDNKTKRLAWVLLIVLFSVIYITILKIAGHPNR